MRTIARQRLDLLLDNMSIPVRQDQRGREFISVESWFYARELREGEYMLYDARGVLVGIFDSIDLDFETIE